MAALNPFKKFAALGKTAGVASKTARSTGLVVAVPCSGACSVGPCSPGETSAFRLPLKFDILPESVRKAKPAMSDVRLGYVIDDFCVKCRRITNHSVVSLVKREPAKVRCRTCYSDHDYRHEIAPPSKKDLKKQDLFKEVLSAIDPAAEEGGTPGKKSTPSGA